MASSASSFKSVSDSASEGSGKGFALPRKPAPTHDASAALSTSASAAVSPATEPQGLNITTPSLPSSTSAPGFLKFTPRRRSHRSRPSFDTRNSMSSQLSSPVGGSPSSSSGNLTSPQMAVWDEEAGVFSDSNAVSASPTPNMSRTGSINSPGSPRQVRGISAEDACYIMATHLYQHAIAKNWVAEDDSIPAAVAVRHARRRYVLSPRDDTRLAPFAIALQTLNPAVAFTYNASVVQAITSNLDPSVNQLYLSSSQRVQVVDRMDELAGVRYAQMACFVRLEGTLVIWCDKVDEFQATAAAWESALVKFVWEQAARSIDIASSAVSPRPQLQSSTSSSVSVSEEVEEKVWDEKSLEEERVEIPRKTLYFTPVYTGLSVALNIVICSLFASGIAREVILDGSYMRCVLLVVIPFMFLVLMFFTDTMIGVIAQILLPIGQMARNSLFFSGKAPIRLTGEQHLPHITVCMPVYKEGLDDVLAPTIESVNKAISTYELQGGTANILVCEDGMQLVDEKEVLRRTDYYERQNCAWVARHPENRAGRFKKSSNLNVAKSLSLRVEDLMAERRPTDPESAMAWSQVDEDRIYEVALQDALAEHEGRVWANGNIRIGDYILMIDSDTRIPEDCFLDAASELEQSPEVAILQHCSGVFLVGAGYFESGIAFFTKCVNWSISWTIANGANAPFMGHNAFLRWSALQHQAIYNPNNNIWSEDHVSEDFVMSLNLLKTGYITRWATYSNSEFLEGVSLSAIDELNRWQKYAFGCSEMVFNPVRYWFTKSPFAKLYRDFLWSPAPIAYKFSASSYVASYWAIACGAPCTIIIFFVQAFFYDVLDPVFYATPPFNILLALIAVFTFGGTSALVIGRYRSQDATLFAAIGEHLRWLLFMVAFFSGLSVPVFLGLMAHVTSYDMRWSATVKDVSVSTVWKELPLIARRFGITYAVMFSWIAAMILLMTDLFGPRYQLARFPVVLPALWCAVWHILYPIVLNPWIMLFRF